MKEYIERQKAKEAIAAYCAPIKNSLQASALNELLVQLDVLPAADVVEVRHGRWELGNVEPGYFTPGGNRPWVCSECGRIVSWFLEKPTEEYCHCGCKMDKEE